MSARTPEPVSTAEAARRALAALEGGEPLCVVTVVAGPDAEPIGRRLVVTAGSTVGDLGDESVNEEAARIARDALTDGGRIARTVELPANGSDGRERGTAHRGATEPAADGWALYCEVHRPRPELVIVGAGHIARPLSRIGSMLGFAVQVLDDRDEFLGVEHFPDADHLRVVDFDDPFVHVEIGPRTYMVLVTRAHEYDYRCILRLMERDERPAYLGMIGSRRRVRAALEALVADGFEPESLERIRSPIGLDIGAETPEEIAVAVAAEMISVMRGGTGTPLWEKERVLRRLERRARADLGRLE